MEDWGSWLVERRSSLTVVSLVFSIVLAYILWAIADRWVLHRGRKGPVQWPILGATVEVLRNFHRFNDWAVSYFLRDGLTFGCKMANVNFVFTADPANLEYILKTNFANYPKGKMFHDIFDIFLGDGIFNVDGESWKQQRKTASFEFASRKLRDFSTVIFRDYSVKVAFIITNACRTQRSLDMQDLFMRFTLDSIFKVAFGYEIDTLKPELPEVPFAKAFDITNEVTSKRFLNPFWKLQRVLKVGNEASVVASAKVVNEFIYSVIKARKLELALSTEGLGNEELHTSGKGDLFTRFMVLNEEGGEQKFTDKNFRDTLLSFIIAGRDTTAVTLSWFVYMITVHPHVGDKIFQELLALDMELQAVNTSNKSEPETLGGEDDLNQRILQFSELLTFDSLLKLHYLHACIMETLRLYPAVPMNAKSPAADDVLPDGTTVKKGNMVSFLTYAMGRMPSLWGPDATEFKPERWLVDGVVQPESAFKFNTFQSAVVDKHETSFRVERSIPVRYKFGNEHGEMFLTRRLLPAMRLPELVSGMGSYLLNVLYFPQQAGPRICLGKDSAMLQLRMCLALLCRFFKFQLQPGCVVKYRQMSTLLLANGLHVKIVKRCD